MSSTNDTYHHLLVQAQPKSILKKSPSPRVLDTLINSETEKNDITNRVCTFNDHQSVKENSSIEIPLTKLNITSNEDSYQYKIDDQLIRTNPPPCADSSSSPTSDNEPQQQRIRIKSKKSYYRPLVATGKLSSSSDDNDERQEKRSMQESKTTLLRSNKYRPTDMQLDEFMRKYQQQGGIPIPNNEDQDQEQIITKLPRNYHQLSSTKQRTSQINNKSINNDTISLLEPIDTITLSSKSLSPLQMLFDVARINQYDRRRKIDQIREYIEEEIGIAAFLTMYKLIKSSQIPINPRQKPFCSYVHFLPHICCLIMLESEEQKSRFGEK